MHANAIFRLTSSLEQYERFAEVMAAPGFSSKCLKDGFWTGILDDKIEGEWKALKGLPPVKEYFWGSGQPNGGIFA